MMSEKPMWMVRSDGGLLFDLFKEKSVVAVGWGEIGSLDQLRSRDAIKASVTGAWPDWLDGRVITSAGQLHRFRNEIQIGDGIVTYDTASRIYLVGEIVGDYKFDPSLVPENPNTRAVRWLGDVDRDRLSVGTRNSLGSSLTLFRLSEDVVAEIREVLTGIVPPQSVPSEPSVADETELLSDVQAKALEFIKDRVAKLPWDAMQELVAGLLRAMGYKTQVSPAGSDRGKDIIASPDGFGFEAPRIVVEVKHRSQQMGSAEIRGFLGGRHPQDRGLYVSTGGFSREALYEADRANIPLQLMDLNLLVHTILQHYEKFDVQTQRILPLTRVYWPS